MKQWGEDTKAAEPGRSGETAEEPTLSATPWAQASEWPQTRTAYGSREGTRSTAQASADNINLYADGMLVKTDDLSCWAVGAGTPYGILCYPTPNGFFSGFVYDLRAYANRILSAAEVLGHYKRVFASEANLDLRVTFDNAFSDTSGNSKMIATHGNPQTYTVLNP